MRSFTSVLLFIALFLLTGTFTVNAQNITVTLAGNGTPAFSGDGGPGNLAEINTPTDVCIDAAHNLYFVDAGNNRIREVSAATGVITTIAGGGASTADGVPAVTASLSGLSKLAVDAAGNVYFSTANKIRMVNNTTGIITTVAGNGSAGYSGDGGPAIAAELKSPSGVSIDAAGNIYIADVSNCRIRKVSAATGIITTIAGTGTSGIAGNGGPATAATLSAVNAISLDASGNIFCANNNSIRKITAATGIITLVGNYSGITGMCSDGGPNLYYDESSCGCHKVVVATGTQTIVANTGGDAYNGEGGNSLLINLNVPAGLCIDASGNIYIADKSNNRIRVAAQLTNTPSFIYGANQLINPCPGYATPINAQIAVADLSAIATESWNVLTPPTMGTLSGFPAAKLSGGTNGLAIPSGASYMPAAGAAGTDSFQVQVSNGTALSIVKVYATIIPVTATGAVIGSLNACPGSVGTLTETVPGIWSVSNTNATINASGGYSGGVTASLQGLTTGTDTLTYTPLSCAVPVTSIITVVPLPDTATISGNDTVCVGGTLTLTDVVPGGTWTRTPLGAGIANVGATTGIVSGISFGSATIKYTTADIAGCTLFVTKNVTVFAPAIAVSGNTVVCLGSAITLAETVPGGIWSINNGNASLVSSTSTSATITGITTGEDTVMYTNTNICGTATVTQLINVNPPAVAGTISGAASVCVGGSTTHYTETSSSGAWSMSNADAHMGPAGNLTTYTAGIDTIIYTVNSGCHVATTTYVVTIGGASAGTITGATSVCAGSAITLADATSGGVWSSSNGNAMVSGSGMVTAVSPGVDTIQYSVTGTCGSSTVASTATVSQVITINSLPYSSIILGPASVCAGSSISVMDSIAGGVWSEVNGNATISGSGTITGVSTGTDIIQYSMTNGCGTSTASETINIDAAPNAGTITGASSVCEGASIALADAAAGGVWAATYGNATVSPSGQVTGYNAGTENIIYSVTNACGTATASQTITINPAPDPGAITGGGPICIGSSLTFTENVSGGMWSANNGDATVSGIGVVTGVAAGTVTVAYTVTNSCGAATSTQSVEIDDCSGTGVNTISINNSINIFPNPANNVLNIETTGGGLQGQTTITDLLGQTMLQQKTAGNTMKVDISAFPAGVYLVNINGNEVRKFVKE